MTLAKPTNADWAEVVANFAPDWAGSLTYNDSEARSIEGVRADIRRWMERLQHRIYGRNHHSKPALEFIGWAEMLRANPHAHLAIRPPLGYKNPDRILKWLAPEWSRSHPARGAHFTPIDHAAGWGSYIAKEERCRAISVDQLIFSS